MIDVAFFIDNVMNSDIEAAEIFNVIPRRIDKILFEEIECCFGVVDGCVMNDDDPRCIEAII